MQRVAPKATLEDRLLPGFASQLEREQLNRPLVHDRGCDMRPLAGIGALGEQAAELVEVAGRRSQDAVRVVVHVTRRRKRSLQAQ